jgi:hypothetical protein
MFVEELKENPGILLVKYSMAKCVPCQRLAPLWKMKTAKFPADIKCLELDVAQDKDLYSLLKSRRQLGGVPVVLAYKKGNLTPFADLCHTGADPKAFDHFLHGLQEIYNQLH